MNEETALNILEQFMLLNSNIDTLNKALAQILLQRPTVVTPTSGTISAPPASPPVESDPPSSLRVSFNPVVSGGPKIEVIDPKGKTKQQPAYVYIGSEQCDPTKPLPECFPHFGKNDCKDSDNCPCRKECKEHPDNDSEEKHGFTPRTEKTIIKPATFDDSEFANEEMQEDQAPIDEKKSDQEKYQSLANDIKELQNAEVLTEDQTGEHKKDYMPTLL